MLTEIMTRFDNDPFEAVQWMDTATASNYATFAPMVLRHANQGDPAARAIVQDGAGHIDTFVRTLIAQGAPRVSLLGGLSSILKHWLAPDVRRALRTPDGDAVSGAITLVKEAQKQQNA
jgi:glucosamine kinase